MSLNDTILRWDFNLVKKGFPPSSSTETVISGPDSMMTLGRGGHIPDPFCGVLAPWTGLDSTMGAGSGIEAPIHRVRGLPVDRADPGPGDPNPSRPSGQRFSPSREQPSPFHASQRQPVNPKQSLKDDEGETPPGASGESEGFEPHGSNKAEKSGKKDSYTSGKRDTPEGVKGSVEMEGQNRHAVGESHGKAPDAPSKSSFGERIPTTQSGPSPVRPSDGTFRVQGKMPHTMVKHPVLSSLYSSETGAVPSTSESISGSTLQKETASTISAEKSETRENFKEASSFPSLQTESYSQLPSTELRGEKAEHSLVESSASSSSAAKIPYPSNGPPSASGSPTSDSPHSNTHPSGVASKIFAETSFERTGAIPHPSVKVPTTPLLHREILASGKSGAGASDSAYKAGGSGQEAFSSPGPDVATLQKSGHTLPPTSGAAEARSSHHSSGSQTGTDGVGSLAGDPLDSQPQSIGVSPSRAELSPMQAKRTDNAVTPGVNGMKVRPESAEESTGIGERVLARNGNIEHMGRDTRQHLEKPVSNEVSTDSSTRVRIPLSSHRADSQSQAPIFQASSPSLAIPLPVLQDGSSRHPHPSKTPASPRPKHPITSDSSVLPEPLQAKNQVDVSGSQKHGTGTLQAGGTREGMAASKEGSFLESAPRAASSVNDSVNDATKLAARGSGKDIETSSPGRKTMASDTEIPTSLEMPSGTVEARETPSHPRPLPSMLDDVADPLSSSLPETQVSAHPAGIASEVFPQQSSPLSHVSAAFASGSAIPIQTKGSDASNSDSGHALTDTSTVAGAPSNLVDAPPSRLTDIPDTSSEGVKGSRPGSSSIPPPGDGLRHGDAFFGVENSKEDIIHADSVPIAISNPHREDFSKHPSMPNIAIPISRKPDAKGAKTSVVKPLSRISGTAETIPLKNGKKAVQPSIGEASSHIEPSNITPSEHLRFANKRSRFQAGDVSNISKSETGLAQSKSSLALGARTSPASGKPSLASHEARTGRGKASSSLGPVGPRTPLLSKKNLFLEAQTHPKDALQLGGGSLHHTGAGNDGSSPIKRGEGLNEFPEPFPMQYVRDNVSSKPSAISGNLAQTTSPAVVQNPLFWLSSEPERTPGPHPVRSGKASGPKSINASMADSLGSSSKGLFEDIPEVPGDMSYTYHSPGVESGRPEIPIQRIETFPDSKTKASAPFSEDIGPDESISISDTSAPGQLTYQLSGSSDMTHSDSRSGPLDTHPDKRAEKEAIPPSFHSLSRSRVAEGPTSPASRGRHSHPVHVVQKPGNWLSDSSISGIYKSFLSTHPLPDTSALQAGQDAAPDIDAQPLGLDIASRAVLPVQRASSSFNTSGSSWTWEEAFAANQAAAGIPLPGAPSLGFDTSPASGDSPLQLSSSLIESDPFSAGIGLTHPSFQSGTGRSAGTETSQGYQASHSSPTALHPVQERPSGSSVVQRQEADAAVDAGVSAPGGTDSVPDIAGISEQVYLLLVERLSQELGRKGK